MATSASAAAAVSEVPCPLELGAGSSTDVLAAAAFFAGRDVSFRYRFSVQPPAGSAEGKAKTPVPEKPRLSVEDPSQVFDAPVIMYQFGASGEATARAGQRIIAAASDIVFHDALPAPVSSTT